HADRACREGCVVLLALTAAARQRSGGAAARPSRPRRPPASFALAPLAAGAWRGLLCVAVCWKCDRGLRFLPPSFQGRPMCWRELLDETPRRRPHYACRVQGRSDDEGIEQRLRRQAELGRLLAA